MKLDELIRLTGAKDMTPEAPKDKEVTCGYTRDLLSWVMGKGQAVQAWITVQSHINVIAVAVLRGKKPRRFIRNCRSFGRSWR